MDTPVIDRIVAESDDLSGKVERLGAFVSGSIFPTLPDYEQTLLNAQLGAMTAYLSVLTLRVAHYTEQTVIAAMAKSVNA